MNSLEVVWCHERRATKNGVHSTFNLCDNSHTLTAQFCTIIFDTAVNA